MRVTWVLAVVSLLALLGGCGDDDSSDSRSAGGRTAKTEPPRAEGNYVHLAADGAVFVVRDTGEQGWTDREGLRRELEGFKERGKPILYSRENPGDEPTPEAFANFKLIVEASEEARLPIRLLREPHPEALVSPEQRRTITTQSVATESSFDELVLSRSHERPVVVLFWAPWSGPDRILKPLVRQAIRAREGRIELVMVNVDEVPSVAARYDVLAVPTLMPVVDGKPAFRRSVGALPRPRIDRYLDQIEQRFR
jgi:thiol-disulfide isomerase/thioredoxin